jgi:hypothetical protein
MTLVVSGIDGPGAMASTTSEIRKAGLSILSSLVKRGGQQQGHSTFIAVCEPDKKPNGQLVLAKHVESAFTTIKEALEGWPYQPKYSFNVQKSPSHYATRRTYVRPRNHKPVGLMEGMEIEVGAERDRNFGGAAIPVFIAQRFHREHSLADKILNIVYDGRSGL